MQERNKRRTKISRLVYYMCIFAMFGAMMLVSKMVLSGLPNIHLTGMFCILLTVVYRVKALIPIYIYVFLEGLFYGFTVWWLIYLYVWAVLWGAVMLLPKRMSPKTAFFVYPLVCALHGAAFGVLSAPVWSFFSGNGLLITIISGLSFDVIHTVGNFAAGFLVLPLSQLLIKLEKKSVYF